MGFRERLSQPIYETVRLLLDAGPWIEADAPHVADAVLAVLGLDDIDNIVKRFYDEWDERRYAERRYRDTPGLRHHSLIRECLLAALTPEEKHGE